MHTRIHKILTWITMLVWVVNGLVCKVLMLVPRHRQIVGAILGDRYAASLTITIGFAEIAMAIWIFSGIQRRLCAVVQILLVSIMNLLEASQVPHLLLFGYWNLFFAFLFILVIWCNEFIVGKRIEPSVITQ